MNINQNTPTFYINLDDNTTRNANMLKLLHTYNFKNITRVPAVNTKTIEKVNEYKNIIDANSYDNLIQNNKLKERTNHYELTNGAIGCYLSHINIYEHIVKNNIDCAIIFEDDCTFDSGPVFFWEKLKSFKIPENTDIFLLNGIFLEEGLKDEISKILFFFCTHSYIITNEGAKKCLQYILPIKMQIDSALSRMSYENKITIYGLINNVLEIKQDSQLSTNIQTLGCEKCNIATEIYKYIDNLNPNTNNIDYNVVMIVVVVLIVIIMIMYGSNKFNRYF